MSDACQGFGLLPVLALVAACSSGKEPAARALTFHEVMKDEVDKNADELWDISNAAIGDAAGLDPAKMTDERWAQIAAKAEAVQQAALKIATMDPLVVAKPGREDLRRGHSRRPHRAPWCRSAWTRIPRRCATSPTRSPRHTGDLATAARAHDAAAAGPLIDQLDGVCEDCHLEYWYPDQKALVNQFRDENSHDRCNAACNVAITVIN